jgi:hypothetical protein
MTSDRQDREWLKVEIRRTQAAILSVNDTVYDSDDRERMRRVTLNSLELLERRINEVMDNPDALPVPAEL